MNSFLQDWAITAMFALTGWFAAQIANYLGRRSSATHEPFWYAICTVGYGLVLIPSLAGGMMTFFNEALADSNMPPLSHRKIIPALLFGGARLLGAMIMEFPRRLAKANVREVELEKST